MVDSISCEHRSWNMSRIRGENTAPELAVRSALHRLGFRFRLHVSSLPGRPDIVLPRHRTVIFVHGCFWHRHLGCKLSYLPKSRVAFWRAKFDANVARDKVVRRELRSLGWRVVVVWQCEAENPDRLASVLRQRMPRRRRLKRE